MRRPAWFSGSHRHIGRRRGRVPRVSRLMALAIKFDGLLRSGAVRDQAELAEFGHVSRARVTQIMNLSLLAPDIQEELLHLPLSNGGRDPIRERMIRPIAAVPDWRKQRIMWEEVKTRARGTGGICGYASVSAESSRT